MQPGELTFAKRLPDLRKARLGLLDNGKRNSNHLLKFLSQRLEEADGVVTTISLMKPSISATAPESQIEELSKVCDFVITGVGD